MNRVKTRRIGAVLILAVVSTTAAGQAKAEVILNVDDLILACPCSFSADGLAGQTHLMPDPASIAANAALESADAGLNLYQLVCLSEPIAPAPFMKVSCIATLFAGANGDFTPDGDFYAEPAAPERSGIADETPYHDFYAMAAH